MLKREGLCKELGWEDLEKIHCKGKFNLIQSKNDTTIPHMAGRYQFDTRASRIWLFDKGLLIKGYLTIKFLTNLSLKDSIY